jgi:transcriptional adapter 2-alpha
LYRYILEPNEYEIMLEGLAAESRIRNRIAELKEYRRSGIHMLSEGEAYDAAGGCTSCAHPVDPKLETN